MTHADRERARREEEKVAFAETVADAVIERLGRRDVRERGLRAVIFVMVGVVAWAIISALYLGSRPAAPSTLSSDDASAIQDVSVSGTKDVTFDLTIEAQRIDITSQASSKKPTLLISVALPAQHCAEIARQLTLRCESGLLRSRPGLSLSWPKSQLLTAYQQGVDGAALRPGTGPEGSDVGIWSQVKVVMPAACAPIPIALEFNGNDFLGQENCSLAPKRWLSISIPLQSAPDRSLATPFVFSGLGTTYMRLIGPSASFAGSDATATVADNVVALVPQETTKVRFSATSRKPVHLIYASAAGRASLNIASAHSQSVSINGHEQLPTNFNRRRDVWLAIVGTVGGLLLAYVFDAVPLPAKLTEARRAKRRIRSKRRCGKSGGGHNDSVGS